MFGRPLENVVTSGTLFERFSRPLTFKSSFLSLVSTFVSSFSTNAPSFDQIEINKCKILGKVWWLICAISYYRVFGAKRRHAKKTPNDDFFVFSHGDLLPGHTKLRNFSCVAFSPPVCHIFAWWGERSPLFAPPGENAKRRHTKTRQMMTFSCFCKATFRDIPCVAFSATVCRITCICTKSSGRLTQLRTLGKRMVNGI